jgi:hypothetical protein
LLMEALQRGRETCLHCDPSHSPHGKHLAFVGNETLELKPQKVFYPAAHNDQNIPSHPERFRMAPDEKEGKYRPTCPSVSNKEDPMISRINKVIITVLFVLTVVSRVFRFYFGSALSS